MNLYNNQTKLIILTLIFVLMRNVLSWKKFCSARCRKQNCTTGNPNDCYPNLCVNGFDWNTTTSNCQPRSDFI